MYLRFVYAQRLDGTQAREGIFRAALDLVDDPLLDAFSAQCTKDLRSWFNTHLARPDRFSRSRFNAYRESETRGLSWFKPDAKEHISTAFELKAVLDENGYRIEVLKETRLGYVLYEDDHQIVAEPFSDTMT